MSVMPQRLAASLVQEFFNAEAQLQYCMYHCNAILRELYRKVSESEAQ